MTDIQEEEFDQISTMVQKPSDDSLDKTNAEGAKKVSPTTPSPQDIKPSPSAKQVTFETPLVTPHPPPHVVGQQHVQVPPPPVVAPDDEEAGVWGQRDENAQLVEIREGDADPNFTPLA